MSQYSISTGEMKHQGFDSPCGFRQKLWLKSERSIFKIINRIWLKSTTFYLSWRLEKIWLRNCPTRRQQLAMASPRRAEYEDRSMPNKASPFCWHWLFLGNRPHCQQRSQYLEYFSCKWQQRQRRILQGSRKNKAKLRNDFGTGNAWRGSRIEEWLLL